MAGTKFRGFRSRSSQRTSANCSAVNMFSCLFHKNVSRSFCPKLLKYKITNSASNLYCDCKSTFNIHIKTYGNQNLRLCRILMNRRRIRVIKTQRECSHLLVDHAVAVDWSSLGNSIQVGGVGHGRHNGGWLGWFGSGGRGGAGVRVGLLTLELVISPIEDVLHLVGQEQGDGTGGDMLGVTHLNLSITQFCNYSNYTRVHNNIYQFRPLCCS